MANFLKTNKQVTTIRVRWNRSR